jgi:hypothetical protein
MCGRIEVSSPLPYMTILFKQKPVPLHCIDSAAAHRRVTLPVRGVYIEVVSEVDDSMIA